VFGKRLGGGLAMIFASALLFGAYHWWTGLGSILATAVFGVAAMTVYRRLGILWPVMAAHYAIDLFVFYA